MLQMFGAELTTSKRLVRVVIGGNRKLFDVRNSAPRRLFAFSADKKFVVIDAAPTRVWYIDEIKICELDGAPFKFETDEEVKKNNGKVC